MSVDVAQNRLALSMKGFGKAKAAAAPEGEGAAAAEEEVDEEEAPGFEDFSEMGITFRVASDDQMTDLDEVRQRCGHRLYFLFLTAGT